MQLARLKPDLIYFHEFSKMKTDSVNFDRNAGEKQGPIPVSD